VNPLFLEVFVVFLGIVMLTIEAVVPSPEKRHLVAIGVGGLALIFIASFFVNPHLPAGAPYAAFYSTDALAMFFKRFSIISAILVIAMSVDYAPVIEEFVPGEVKGAGIGEFMALPVLTCAGFMWMASAVDFIAIFVSLELVTISFYVLVAYLRLSNTSLEAGTKYLILGALSTGFLVYGITWIFGVTGQTNLARIAAAIPDLPADARTPLLFGFGLVMVALGFKIAGVPFQFWVPDVYQGAPTPITAYLSVASKATGFVVLLRVLDTFLATAPMHDRIMPVLLLLTAATLLFGNLAALPQTNVKRLLAYSSIAHAGYLLMAVSSLGAGTSGAAKAAIVFYLGAYLLMTFLAFFVLAIVARTIGGDELMHFNGLGRRSPWLAGAMLMAMLSLAGIPFTAGFLGKFFIFGVALEARHYWLVVLGTITVGCGFYYYLRIIRAMYWQPSPENVPAIVTISLPGRISMAALAVLIVVAGVCPQTVFTLLSGGAQ
jgi:NADH-quinone oxidoreductase subunit N